MNSLLIKRNNLLPLFLFVCLAFLIILFCIIEIEMLQRVVLPILTSCLIVTIIYFLLKILCKDKFVGKAYLISILVHFIFILFWQIIKYYIIGLHFPTDYNFQGYISDVDGIQYHSIGTYLANNYNFDHLSEKYYGGLFPKIVATLYLLFGKNPFIVTCFNSISSGFIWLINNTKKEYEFLKSKIGSNKNIVKNSNKIFYGYDNADAQKSGSLKKYNNFMNTSDIFPLKRMQFEDTEFWAPNNHIKILEDYFGRNWCEIPDNIIPPHLNEREE